MYKKALTALCGAMILFPVGTTMANTNTNVSISITSGETGISDFTPSTIQFDSYKIGSATPAQQNRTPASFNVSDYSGSQSGWTVSVQFTDFISGSTKKLSNHNGAITVKCKSTAFKDQAHSCQNDTKRDITSSGTLPVVIASAPNDKTSAGLFNYNIPTGFFELTFDKTVEAGEYTADLILNFSNTYTP